MSAGGRVEVAGGRGGRAPLSGRALRPLGGRVSARVRPRPLLGGLGLAAVGLALALLALGTGDVPVSPGDVVGGVLGTADGGTTFIVRELRLPRVLLALLVGGALGASGAIFQALTRNPLGSPDVIGFQTGAVTGALVVVLGASGTGQLSATAGAVLGGVVTAAAVFGLARRDGTVQPFRLVLVGVGLTAFTVAVNQFLLSRARVEEVQLVTRWTLGSLNAVGWDRVVPLAGALVVLLLALVPATRAVRALELGDDLAAGLGLRVERTRVALVALGVLLVAAGVAAVGPVLFVALVAPQVARRVLRVASVPLGASALCGGVLLLAADLLGQRLPEPLPAGVVTGAVGGLYLVLLLSLSWRSTSA